MSRLTPQDWAKVGYERRDHEALPKVIIAKYGSDTVHLHIAGDNDYKIIPAVELILYAEHMEPAQAFLAGGLRQAARHEQVVG